MKMVLLLFIKNPFFSIKGNNNIVVLLLNKTFFSKDCLNLLDKSLLEPIYLLLLVLWVKYIYTSITLSRLRFTN